MQWTVLVGAYLWNWGSNWTNRTFGQTQIQLARNSGATAIGVCIDRLSFQRYPEKAAYAAQLCQWTHDAGMRFIAWLCKDSGNWASDPGYLPCSTIINNTTARDTWVAYGVDVINIVNPDAILVIDEPSDKDATFTAYYTNLAIPAYNAWRAAKPTIQVYVTGCGWMTPNNWIGKLLPGMIVSYYTYYEGDWVYSYQYELDYFNGNATLGKSEMYNMFDTDIGALPPGIISMGTGAISTSKNNWNTCMVDVYNYAKNKGFYELWQWAFEPYTSEYTMLNQGHTTLNTIGQLWADNSPPLDPLVVGTPVKTYPSGDPANGEEYGISVVVTNTNTTTVIGTVKILDNEVIVDQWERSFAPGANTVEFSTSSFVGDHTWCIDCEEVTTPTETFGAEDSNNTGSPIGGGSGYLDTFSPSDPRITVTVSTLSQLQSALASATSGDVIYVAGTAQIDFTSLQMGLIIPTGVTVASNRGVSGAAGARIYKTTEFETEALQTLFRMASGSHDVRITGLWLDCPHKTAAKYPYRHDCVSFLGSSYNGEVDNCEVTGASRGGVWIEGGTGHHVHHSNIHHCWSEGYGYGVLANGHTLVEANTFDYNRHCIASSGAVDDFYEARFNIIGPVGNGSHQCDMHNGGRDLILNYPNGNMYIHHNTFHFSEHHSITSRGVPSVDGYLGATYIDHNWFDGCSYIYSDQDSYGCYSVAQKNSCGNVVMTRNLIGGNGNMDNATLSISGPILCWYDIPH